VMEILWWIDEACDEIVILVTRESLFTL